MLEIEIWRKIRDWPYEVSNTGKVRRLWAKPGWFLGGSHAGTSRQYPIVSLSMDGVSKSFSRHRLVADAFIGLCPKGYECHHKDHNTFNPRADNLEYVTPSQNIQYAISEGHFQMGESRWNAKLTKSLVAEIRKRYEGGEPYCSIADDLNLKRPTVAHVVRRRTWRHVA